MDVAVLPTRDGGLKAISLVAHADAGIAVNSTIAGLARLIYPAEAKHLADFDVVSHLPPGAPFRGPGGPPMAFALEQAIDEAALRLNTDPIALRKRWDNNPNRQRLYDWAAGLDCWRIAGQRRQAAAAATGAASAWRRATGSISGSCGPKVELAVGRPSPRRQIAAQDIGTGTRSVIADTVAREFELEPHEVEVRIGDCKLPPGPASGGSRVTASVVPPTLLAIEKLKAASRSRAGTGRRPAPTRRGAR